MMTASAVHLQLARGSNPPACLLANLPIIEPVRLPRSTSASPVISLSSKMIAIISAHISASIVRPAYLLRCVFALAASQNGVFA